MKVVCDACHAKYQVPDERVAGRKLKIRCRKCSAAIIVQGDAVADNIPLASASEPPPAYSEDDTTSVAGEAEWHVSLDGEQHGPYATSQMAGMLRGSQLDWDVYVWRESYGDWKAASDSETLVRAVVAAAEDEPTAAVAAPVEAVSPFDDENDPTRMAQSHNAEALMPMARTSFAARAASRSQPPENSLPRAPSQPPMTSSYVPRAASQPPTTSSGYARSPSYAAAPAEPVYGAYEAAPAYSGNSAPALRGGASVYDSAPALRGGASVYDSAPALRGGASVYDSAPALRGGASVYASPRASAHELTGERHEDSVLFAAQNLSLSASAASSPAPSSRSAGYAAAEGSGLIDIRALAALARTQAAHPTTNGNGASHTNGSTNGNGSSYATNGNGRSSDLLLLANQTGAFSHLDSLAPIDRASRTPSKAVPAAILAGSMMVAAALLIGILLTRSTPQQPVAAASTLSAPVTAPVALPTTPEPAAAPSAAPAAAAAPEPAAVAAPAVAAREPAERPSASSGRRSTTKSGRAQKPAPEPVAKPVVKAAVASAKADSKKEKAPSIDDLVAAEKNPAPPAKAESAKSIDDDLLAAPAKPTRSPTIDELLDTAVIESKTKNAAPASAAAAALPETPTKEQVGAALRAVAPAVLACGEGQTLESTQAQAAVTVAGATGKVSSVRVSGVQGAVGSCVARAVREASFPKFAKASLSINFPFKLK